MISLDKIILTRVTSAGKFNGMWEAKSGSLRAHGDNSIEAHTNLLEKAAEEKK